MVRNSPHNIIHFLGAKLLALDELSTYVSSVNWFVKWGAFMGQKLNKAPVCFVIVQARFNPIFALDSYVPAIQDNLRKHGFPDAQKSIQNTFNLNLNPSVEGVQAQAQVPVSQLTQYRLVNAERTSSFVLDQGALSFQTTDYDVFDGFLEMFLSGLEMVDSTVQLSYTDRIGLRYIDAVLPAAGEQISSYLNDCVLGLHGKAEGQVAHSFNETAFKVDDISVTARAIIQDGPLGFPPDLQPQVLEVLDRFRSFSGTHAVLDTDGSVAQREAFKLDSIRAQTTAIHDEIDKTFKMTVTEHAMREWA